MPKDVCEAQCKPVPIVPIQLQNKFFRGLQINQGYVKGEWDANFTKTDVTVTDPSNRAYVGSVSTVSNYLVVTWKDGSKISSLWEFANGPVTDFFAWAWSAPNGPVPASYDAAMHTSGMTEYQFVSCPSGSSYCHF